MRNLGKIHYEVVKWVLKYLKGTTIEGILFDGMEPKPPIVGFIDLDYAGDLDKRRSLTRYLFKFRRGLMIWKALLQHIVAYIVLSTTKAKYLIATEVVKEALWLRGLTEEGPSQDTYMSAIHLSKNHQHYERTMHVNVKYHFIRDVTEIGLVSLVKVHTMTTQLIWQPR